MRRSKFCLAAVVLLVGLVVAPLRAETRTAGHDSAQGRTLPLDRHRIVTEADDAPHRGRCFCPEPSPRNLLHLDRDAIYRPGQHAAGVSVPVTLKVTAIRVQFPLEDPDNPATTGRGRFDLRDTTEYLNATGHRFDSAPHNRRYFETHLRALNLYWHTVSNGEVSLESTVFPLASDSAYEMPHPMSFYGRERAGDSGIAYGLEQFVIDAVRIASHDPDVRLNNYDAVIIFHAGSDRQSDILRDTPEDLFTGFIRLADPVSLRSGAPFRLREAIIMPETVIQDNRITVLNAVMAHEFGHQLGLVDLYNTRPGSRKLTQVGNFSLMDNNAADVGVEVSVAGRRRILFGALPVFPDAWSRLYLGFVSDTVVRNEKGVVVPAAEGESLVPQATAQVVKVPISSTEYYLIENRRVDIDQLGPSGLRLDSVTNVVLEPVDTLTVHASREYDFLLPGQGLLIWHVDEGVAALDYVTGDDIANNFLANSLQWDAERRFLRLIEADGLVNFGGFFSAGTGSARDYFYYPNNTKLSATTNPPAISNTGARTGIRISNISPPLLDMQLDISVDGPLSGFPVYSGFVLPAAAAPVVVDLTPVGNGQWRFPGDGRPEIFATSRQYILGWNWDGTPLTASMVIDTIRSFDTTIVTHTMHPVAAAAPADSDWIAPPLVADMDRQPPRLVAVTRGGRVYVWKFQDADADGLFDSAFVLQTLSPPSAPPIIWDGGGAQDELFIPTADGGFAVIDLRQGSQQEVAAPFPGVIRGAAGTRHASSVAVFHETDGAWSVGALKTGGPHVTLDADSLLPPALGDLDRDSAMDAVVADVGGRLWVLDSDLTPLQGFPIDLDVQPMRPPVLADVDRDGYLDIVIVGDGFLCAFARNGALLPNFPVLLGARNATDSSAVAPIAADYGETDRLTLITGGVRRMVFGFDGNAAPNAQFPRALGAQAVAPGAWSLCPAQNEAAVFVRAADGFLYAFEAPFVPEPSNALWPMAAHDPRRTAVVPLDALEPVKTAGVFFAPERAFVYPNPARDRAIVRYWLGDDADVRIRIFDIAGNLVLETDGPGKGGLYNEWAWNCTSVASGVYFARIDVTGLNRGEKETALCKLAVVQ